MAAFVQGLRKHLFMGYSAAMLAVFFLIPFAIMIRMSFNHRVESGFYLPGWELTHYKRFFSPLFTNHLWVTIEFAVMTAALAVLIAFPFTFFLSRYSRRIQVVVLVFVLSVLSLSEVIVAYSWSVLLSKPAGISNLLVWLGLMEKSTSWARGFWAMILSLTYFNLPIAVLIMYPQCTRLDREVTEAAQTLGASPVRTFITIVIPMLRTTIMTAFIILLVFTMGAFVTPTWLGRPEHWMYAMLISDEALLRGNFPFAAALGMLFLLVTMILVGLTVLLGRQGKRHMP